MRFQSFFDTLLAQTLLRLIPHTITPNMVSWSRVALLPFILYVLSIGAYLPGVALFSIAVLTDVVDGALARTRNQITEMGKVLDAIADRGLIAIPALMLIPPRFGWSIVVVIGMLEILNTAMAYRSRQQIGYNPGANWLGKIKMALQSSAMIALLIGIVIASPGLERIAFALLILSAAAGFSQAWHYPSPQKRTLA